MGILTESLNALAPESGVDTRETLPESFGRGLRAGALSAGAQLNTLAGALGAKGGASPEFVEGRYNAARGLRQEANEAAPQIGTWDQVNDARSFGNYAAGLIGGSTPSIAAAGTAAALTGGGAIPAMLAGGAVMAPLEVGDTLQRQQAAGQEVDLGRAALHGGASALAQGALPGLLGAKIMGRAGASMRQPLRTTVGKEALAIPGEALAEGAGEAIKQLGSTADSAGQLDWDQIKENAIGGAVAGGAIGAGGVAAHAIHSPGVVDAAKRGAKGLRDAATGLDLGGKFGAAKDAAGQAGTDLGALGQQGLDKAGELVNKAKGVDLGALAGTAKAKVRSLGDILKPGEADDAEEAAQGRPLASYADKIRGAVEGVSLESLMGEEGKARVEKASTWANEMLADAGITPERRAQIVGLMRNIKDEASVRGLAALKASRDASLRALDAIDAMVKPTAEGKAAPAEERKQSKVMSGMRQAIQNVVMPSLQERHPDLTQNPDAMNKLADSLRKVITAMTADGNLDPTTYGHLQEVFGDDARTVLEEIHATVGDADRAKTDKFFSALNRISENENLQKSRAQVVSESLATPASPRKVKELVSYLQHFTSAAFTRGKTKEEAQYQIRKVRQEMRAVFGDKADAVLEAFAPRSQEVNALDGATGGPGLESDSAADTTPAGGLSDLGALAEPVSKKAMDSPGVHRGKYGSESQAEREVREAEAKDERVRARWVPAAEFRELTGKDIGTEGGGVIAERLEAGDKLSSRELQAMRWDTKKQAKDPKEHTAKIDLGNGTLLDATKIVRVMLPEINGELPAQIRTAQAFLHGLAKLQDHVGYAFDVPDSTVLAQSGKRSFTYGEARQLDLSGTSPTLSERAISAALASDDARKKGNSKKADDLKKRASWFRDKAEEQRDDELGSDYDEKDQPELRAELASLRSTLAKATALNADPDMKNTVQFELGKLEADSFFEPSAALDKKIQERRAALAAASESGIERLKTNIARAEHELSRLRVNDPDSGVDAGARDKKVAPEKRDSAQAKAAAKARPLDSPDFFVPGNGADEASPDAQIHTAVAGFGRMKNGELEIDDPDVFKRTMHGNSAPPPISDRGFTANGLRILDSTVKAAQARVGTAKSKAGNTTLAKLAEFGRRYHVLLSEGSVRLNGVQSKQLLAALDPDQQLSRALELVQELPSPKRPSSTRPEPPDEGLSAERPAQSAKERTLREALDAKVDSGEGRKVDGVYYVDSTRPTLGGTIGKTTWVNMAGIRKDFAEGIQYPFNDAQKKEVMELAGISPEEFRSVITSVKKYAAFVRDHELSHAEMDDEANYPKTADGKPDLKHPDAIAIEVRATLDAWAKATAEDDRPKAEAAQVAAPRTSRQAASAPTALTAAQRKEVTDYVAKVLGPRIKVAFEPIPHAGDYGQNLIRVSVHALNPLSVGHHEAMHALFERLMHPSADPVLRNTLLSAASSEPVLQRLRQLLRSEPDALAQLTDAEERVAYMYQFWAAGQLKLGGEAGGWFAKIAAALRKVFKIWSTDERAMEIMAAFHSGALQANPGPVGRALVAGGHSAAIDKLRDMSEVLRNLGEAAASTGSARLRETGVPALRDLADAIKRQNTDEGDDPGFIPAARTERARVMNELMGNLRTASEADIQEALRAMQTGARAGTNSARVVQLVKRTLKGLLKYMQDAGVAINDLGPDYFPRVYDPSKLAMNRASFEALLTRHGIQDAAATTDKIINNEGSTFQLELNRPGMQHAKSRTLDMIPDAELAPFMKKDMLDIMNNYVYQATRRAEWARRFSDDSSGVELLKERAARQGASRKQLRDVDAYIKSVDGTLGDMLDPRWRGLFGNMIAYQNIRLLPLSIFSSVVDPLGIAVRGGTVGDAWAAFKRGVREAVPAVRGTLKNDAAADFAEAMGVVDNAMLQHAVGEMYGQGMMGDTARKINDAFFRYNLMEGFNRSMRVGATAAAVKFLEAHADGKASPHSARWLGELGYAPGTVPLDASGALKTTGLSDAELAKLRVAINRWVDGAVLRPDAADKPIWMNDPRWALVSHLKQFVYAFHQTIVRRVIHEAKQGNYKPAMVLASYVPTMIAADLVKAAVTPGDPPWDEDAQSMIWHGVERSGMLGVGQFAVDTQGGVLGLAGPSIEQMAGAVEVMGGERGAGSFALKALPANALYVD